MTPLTALGWVFVFLIAGCGTLLFIALGWSIWKTFRVDKTTRNKVVDLKNWQQRRRHETNSCPLYDRHPPKGS